MSNKYKQGVDKVAVDESFPYPIKLTYDDENVYLTVLRIPDYTELKLSSYIQNGINKPWYHSTGGEEHRGTTPANYLDKLYLVVEHENPHPRHFNGNHGSASAKANGRHPSKGGTFCIYNDLDIWVRRPTEGETYSFPKRDVVSRSVKNLRVNNAFTYVRGTFRFNRCRVWSSNKVLERTGIYSNTVKLVGNFRNG